MGRKQVKKNIELKTQPIFFLLVFFFLLLFISFFFFFIFLRKNDSEYGFPGGSVIKNMHANTGDMDSIPESGRPPGVGNGNPLQYSCKTPRTE